MHFTERELATTLAALRHWQYSGKPDYFADHFGGFGPLSDEEIDGLCEALNEFGCE